MTSQTPHLIPPVYQSLWTTLTDLVTLLSSSGLTTIDLKTLMHIMNHLENLPAATNQEYTAEDP